MQGNSYNSTAKLLLFFKKIFDGTQQSIRIQITPFILYFTSCGCPRELMAGYYGRSYNEIMSLALLYIVNAILIGYGILYIDIIIFETLYTKYNMFNLIHHPPYA